MMGRDGSQSADFTGETMKQYGNNNNNVKGDSLFYFVKC